MTSRTTGLSLFPARVRFVNQDGTLTPEGYRALQVVLQRTGGVLGDNGVDTFAPFMGDDANTAPEFSAPLSQTSPPEPVFESVQQPAPPFEGVKVGQYAFLSVGTDAAAFFGYGTWTQINGRFPVAYQSGDPDFGTLGATGGAKTTTVATHDNHTHDVTSNVTDATGNFTAGAVPAVTGITNNTVTSTIENPALDHDPASILPPFLVMAVWRRDS